MQERLGITTSPIFLVPNADDTLRMCIDDRLLNNVRDAYPLPRIEDLLNAMREMTVFYVLDLKSGFYQVPARGRDRHKTAFVTPQGLYEFNVMHFWLVNGSIIFDRMTNELLETLTDVNVR